MQIKDLVLNDGTADKTYSVISTQAGPDIPAAWKNGTSAINAFRIEASTRRVKGSRRSKAEIRFVRPVVQTVDGIESLAETATFVVSGTLPDILPATERQKIIKELRALLGTDIIDALVANDSPAY